MKTTTLLLAGFGGQGALFAGKILAWAGLDQGLEVSWLPSYGPEMRGGTANCSVTISDSPIGSPIVSNPDILVVFNKPSFEKYVNTVKPGGCMFVDSSLVDLKSDRDDIKMYYIPATGLAKDAGNVALTNVILLGKLIKETGIFTEEQVAEALEKNITARNIETKALNKKVLHLGTTL